MTPSSSRGRERAKATLHHLFVAGQRLGVDILPRHFYSAIPDVHELRRTSLWRAPRSMVGVDGLDSEQQLVLLRSWLSSAVLDLLDGTDVHAEACRENGAVGFGPSEASVLFAFVASQRPAKVLQVGAGVSTAVVLAAAAAVGHSVELVCVDPFPTPYLTRLADEGRIRLDRRPAQEVGLEDLTALADGDLFFVDSTHTVKPGSEVNRIVFEVLPRLEAGVWVHVHDVWFPYDYARDVLTRGLFFWNESPLLHAFLIDNARISVQLCTSWLHYAEAAALGEVVPGYRADPGEHGLQAGDAPRGHFPSSAYLRVHPGAPSRRTAAGH